MSKKCIPPYIPFYIVKLELYRDKLLQNIDCGYTLEPPCRGGSNEYPQSMFWIKNKKNRYTPCKPQFFYIRVRFKGIYISRTCFPDEMFFRGEITSEFSG